MSDFEPQEMTVSEALETEIQITVDRVNDDDLVQASKYVLMKDKQWSMTRICEAFGFSPKSRASMYALVQRWTKSGTLDKARNELMKLKFEETYAEMGRVVDDWPLILGRIRRIAKDGKSDYNVLLAAQFLKDNVVDPIAATLAAPGSHESSWAARANEEDFNPLALPGLGQA